MNKLLNARKTMRKNGRKGFTLIELIVVIVIIAILVAALAPAVLGVIKRANRSADEADIRNVMMAGSVAGTLLNPPRTPVAADVLGQLTGAANVFKGTYRVYFDGAVAVGCMLDTGRSGDNISIGITTTNYIDVAVA